MPPRPLRIHRKLLYLSVIGVAACGTAYAALRLHYGIAKGPLLFVESTHDFGDVGPDQDLRWTIQFLNIGWREVRVKEVHTSCGCVATTTTTERIACGGKGAIDVVMHTRDARMPKEVRQSVRVSFEGASVPETEFALKATVVPYLIVAPDSLCLSDRAGKRERVKVRRGTLDPTLFQELRFATSGSGVEVAVVDRQEEEVSADVWCDASPGAVRIGTLQIFGRVSNQSDRETMLYSTDIRRNGPTLIPSAFVVSTPKNDLQQASAQSTSQRFELHGDDDLRILDIEVPTGSGVCARISETRTSFEMWLDDSQHMDNPASHVTVTYAPATRATADARKLQLPVRVLP